MKKRFQYPIILSVPDSAESVKSSATILHIHNLADHRSLGIFKPYLTICWGRFDTPGGCQDYYRWTTFISFSHVSVSTEQIECDPSASLQDLPVDVAELDVENIGKLDTTVFALSVLYHLLVFEIFLRKIQIFAEICQLETCWLLVNSHHSILIQNRVKERNEQR